MWSDGIHDKVDKDVILQYWTWQMIPETIEKINNGRDTIYSPCCQCYFDNSYVIDLKQYAPVYDENFKSKFYLNNHLNAAGYAITAKFVISYIDYIIRHNLQDFSEIGLVNTPYKNYKIK
jgi:hypothetical protein